MEKLIMFGIAMGWCDGADFDGDLSITFYDCKLNDAGKAFFASNVGDGSVKDEDDIRADFENGIFSAYHDMTDAERKAALETGELSEEDNAADLADETDIGPQRQHETILTPNWAALGSLPRVARNG